MVGAWSARGVPQNGAPGRQVVLDFSRRCRDILFLQPHVGGAPGIYGGQHVESAPAIGRSRVLRRAAVPRLFQAFCADGRRRTAGEQCEQVGVPGIAQARRWAARQ